METLKKYWWLWLIIALLLVWYFWPKGANAAKRTTAQCEQDVADANKEGAMAKQAPLPNPVKMSCPHGNYSVSISLPVQQGYLQSKGWK